MLKRLEKFVEPFMACLRRPEPKDHAQVYLAVLLSNLERKNTESIAYRHDQDRQNLQLIFVIRHYSLLYPSTFNL